MAKIAYLEVGLEDGRKVKVNKIDLPNALIRKLSKSVERFTQPRRITEPSFDPNRRLDDER